MQKNQKSLQAYAQRHCNMTRHWTTEEERTANNTYPKGGVSCSADIFVQAESSVLRMKFSGKSPALRVAAKRWQPFKLTYKMTFIPNDFRHVKTDATKVQLRELKRLIDEKASETEVHRFIDSNRELFLFALHGYKTGHHGSIVLSKQNIRPHLKTDSSKGLIPDFLVAGDSSNGYEWWVIELKGIDELVFTKDKDSHAYFSSTMNKGIFQLLEYIDFCSENQTYLRDTLQLPNFREPNGLIIIGTKDEFDDRRLQKLKASWNRLLPKRLEIRTYNWLLQQFEENDAAFNFRQDKSRPSEY